MTDREQNERFKMALQAIRQTYEACSKSNRFLEAAYTMACIADKALNGDKA